jgi:hypothetical protein
MLLTCPFLKGWKQPLAGYNMDPKCHDSVLHMRLIVISPSKNVEIISNSVQKFSVGKQKIFNLIFLFIFYEFSTRNALSVTQYIEEFLYY